VELLACLERETGNWKLLGLFHRRLVRQQNRDTIANRVNAATTGALQDLSFHVVRQRLFAYRTNQIFSPEA
jgi:hypothetical protein